MYSIIAVLTKVVQKAPVEVAEQVDSRILGSQRLPAASTSDDSVVTNSPTWVAECVFGTPEASLYWHSCRVSKSNLKQTRVSNR